MMIGEKPRLKRSTRFQLRALTDTIGVKQLSRTISARWLIKLFKRINYSSARSNKESMHHRSQSDLTQSTSSVRRDAKNRKGKKRLPLPLKTSSDATISNTEDTQTQTTKVKSFFCSLINLIIKNVIK